MNATFSEFTPMEYLQIDIATNYGLDKLNWNERIQWVNDHEVDLETLVPHADEPAMYYAGVQAYRKAQKKEPIGYGISLDATASGLQILSVLVGCETSAKLCNVVSTGNREDAYTKIYERMCERVGSPEKLSREPVKQAVMCSLYGSELEPIKAFGTGELLAAFYDTMREDAPGAWQLNEVLKAMWDPEALSYSWVLPDNFHVHTPVMGNVTHTVNVMGVSVPVEIKENRPQEEGKSLSPNIVHSIDGMIVREISRRCTYDIDTISALIETLMESKNPWGNSTKRTKDKLVAVLWDHYENTGFLSARILESLDQENLGLVNSDVILRMLKSMPETPFPVLAVHDCFRVHPNHANDLRRQYNKILSEIPASDILADIMSQVSGVQQTVIKAGDLSELILEADYAMC